MKRNTLTLHSSLLEFLHRVVLHNCFFPKAPLCLEGFVDSDEVLLPVVSQLSVSSDRHATQSEITAYMHGLGFACVFEHDYHNALLGIVANDCHPANALIDKDGSLVVIDASLIAKKLLRPTSHERRRA
jgi:hypothetical protein